MMNAYLSQYQTTQVCTASPEQMLLMLYDGAIRFLTQAAAAMATGDVAGQARGISKALAIIGELSETLDHEIGGEIAANLDALYHYMTQQLTRANLADDPEPLGQVRGLLCGLRETWAEAIRMQRAAAAVGQPLAAAGR